MILAIDVGNTNIVIGCIDDEKTYFEERLSTDSSKTALELAYGIKAALELYSIDIKEIEGAIVSTVVPSITMSIISAVEKLIGKTPIVVGPGVKTGLNIKIDDPRSVGSDLIAAAVAGINGFGAPLFIIDMGTATTISVIDKDGMYIGGLIAPGVNLSMSALTNNTAQLPDVRIEGKCRAIGRSTAECMKSGVILGCASMIDGMIERMTKELGYAAPVIATGGLASTVVPMCNTKITLCDDLVLKGLNIIYRKNK